MSLTKLEHITKEGHVLETERLYDCGGKLQDISV